MARISEINIVNIRAISKAEASNLSGNHILVSAPNECGKTTVIELMSKAANLGRKDGPGTKVVKDGERKGEASYVLDNGYKIKYSNVEGKEKLEIFSPDGIKVQKPKKEILEMFRTIDFDVNRDFIQLTPSKRRDAVCKLAGVDLSEHDAAVKVAEENRATASREVKHWQTHQVDYDQSLVGKPNIDPSELSEKRAKKEKQQQHLESMKRSLPGLEAGAVSLAAEMKKLQEKEIELATKIADVKKFLGTAKDQTGAIVELKSQIESANTANEAIRVANEAAKTNTKLAEAESAHDAATAEVVTLKQSRIDAVKEPIGLLGLGLGEDGTELLFTDSKGVVLPVDSANSATKVMIGAKIAINLIKSRELQVLPIDLSFLDKKHREELYKVADAAGVQLFAEKHTDEGELTIITQS